MSAKLETPKQMAARLHPANTFAHAEVLAAIRARDAQIRAALEEEAKAYLPRLYYDVDGAQKRVPGDPAKVDALRAFAARLGAGS